MDTSLLEMQLSSLESALVTQQEYTQKEIEIVQDRIDTTNELLRELIH